MRRPILWECLLNSWTLFQVSLTKKASIQLSKQSQCCLFPLWAGMLCSLKVKRRDIEKMLLSISTKSKMICTEEGSEDRRLSLLMMWLRRILKERQLKLCSWWLLKWQIHFIKRTILSLKYGRIKKCWAWPLNHWIYKRIKEDMKVWTHSTPGNESKEDCLFLEVSLMISVDYSSATLNYQWIWAI